MRTAHRLLEQGLEVRLEMAEEVWCVGGAVVSFHRCEASVAEAKHTLPREDDDAPTDDLPTEQMGVRQM